MADLAQALLRLKNHPLLTCLSTCKILAFFRLVIYLKMDILLAQPASVSMSDPPPVLPLSVQVFLADATKIPYSEIAPLWEETRFILWNLPSAEQALLEDEEAFKKYGLPRGISASIQYTLPSFSNGTKSPLYPVSSA